MGCAEQASLGKVLNELANEIEQENLVEEIKQPKEMEGKSAKTSNNCVGITASIDTGWQKRASGILMTKKVAKGIWKPKRHKETEWPRDDKGKFLKDRGKLPLHVDVIEKKLADPIHRRKCFGKALYKESKKKKQSGGLNIKKTTIE